jgi:hypothetical protein
LFNLFFKERIALQRRGRHYRDLKQLVKRHPETFNT